MILIPKPFCRLVADCLLEMWATTWP